jgi:acetyl-CoA carboxylase biotin carboxyl carrier protein
MNDKNKPSDALVTAGPGGKIDFDEIRRVIALLEEKNLSLFEFEVDGYKIKIGRAGPVPASPPPLVIQSAGNGAATLAEAASPAPVPAPEPDATMHVMTSPMVGTFYRSPDPTAAPFVDIGDPVKKGQTLCIVEAMKLMNEIESDLDGTVTEIFAENGKPVEFGQKLFAIKPASQAA